MAEVKFFQSPDYEASSSEWREIRDFYEGKRDVLVKEPYLVFHQLERAPNGGAMIRGIREQISGYTNFLASVISAYLSLMFRNPMDTSQVENVIGKENMKNVDGRGTSLEAFIRDQIAKSLMLYGRPLVRTDTFDVDAKSSADEQQLGQRPIWSIIHPLDAPDWEFAQTKLTKFRHEYVSIEPRASLMEQPKQSLYTRVYQQNGASVEVTILKADKAPGGHAKETKWERIGESKILPMTELPIAGAFNSETWVRDVATEQRRHWNLSSDLDNAVHYQAYAIRVAKGIEEAHQKMALSEYTVLFLPRDGSLEQLQPVYPQALIERLDRCERNLFSLAFNMARSPAAGSQAVEGGDTIRQRKDDMIAFIQSQLEVIEGVANQAIKHWAMMSNKQPAEVKLSRKITLEDVDQLLAVFQALHDELSALPVWKKKVLKQLAAAQGFGDDTEVNAEIDAMKDKPAMGAALEAGRPRLLELMRGNRQKEAGSGANSEA